MDFKRDNEVKSHIQVNPAQLQLDHELELPREVPLNFIGGQNRGQFSGGLEQVPSNITIHQTPGLFSQGFEQVPSNFIVGHNPGPFGQGFRGQFGPTQFSLGPDLNQFSPELAGPKTSIWTKYSRGVTWRVT